MSRTRPIAGGIAHVDALRAFFGKISFWSSLDEEPSLATPRRFNPSIFIIASLTAAAILLAILAIPQRLMKDQRWEVLRLHVAQIAQLAGSVVDGDLHHKLMNPANYSDELYALALKPLVRFHSASPDIFYVYTMINRGSATFFVLDTAMSRDLRTTHQLQPSHYMEPFELREEYEDGWLQQIAAGKTYVTPEYQHDDYGYFLSGHAPIYDSKGTYSGFVGVDFDLGYYLAQEARFDRTFAGSVAAALLMSLGIGYVVARYYHLMQQRAAERERNRIARNVHDGVLQGLTAIALNLKTCSQRADSPLREELDAARQLLVGEQRRVRALVDGTRLSGPIKKLTLAAAAEELIAELEAQWHCEIPLQVKPENAEVFPNVVEQLRLILAEAVANSIKHGQARRVTIDMDRSLQGLGVNICDNGTGFPALSGIYEHEDLSALDVGPRSILERVRELGGRVTLITSSNGSQLRIHLPV